VSPWVAPGIYLGSVDFVKRADVAASLDAHVWDLLVVDEAHTATSPTDRHAALSTIAARARRLVTITATPYSGDTASFASRAALGAAPGGPPPLMFRRSRQDAGDPRRRRHRFAAVRITRTESRLQRLLERYCRDVWREAPATSKERGSPSRSSEARAVVTGRRLASLRRRLDLLLQRTRPRRRQLTLFDEEDSVDDADDLPEGCWRRRVLPTRLWSGGG
jgi:superfamily II DNA or RNA helicase